MHECVIGLWIDYDDTEIVTFRELQCNGKVKHFLQ